MRKHLLVLLAWAVVTAGALGQTVTPNFDITSTNGGGGGGGGGVTSVACTPVGGVACTVASPTGAAVVTVDTSGALAPSSVTTGTIAGTPTVALTNATGLPISTGVSGLGTGVAGALAVNVGTAGAPVVNGGALGTPSSATLTNASGTAASLTAGHVTTNANLTGVISSTGNATTVTAVTGTGSTLVTNSSPTINTPTFVAPALGTPSSATLTNATGLPTTGLTGTLAAAQFPALTGDVTTSTGALATTLANTAVSAGTCTSCNLTIDAKGRVTAQASGSAGGSPAGASGTIQYNNGGSFGGSSLTQNTSTNVVTASSGLSVTGTFSLNGGVVSVPQNTTVTMTNNTPLNFIAGSSGSDYRCAFATDGLTSTSMDCFRSNTVAASVNLNGVNIHSAGMFSLSSGAANFNTGDTSLSRRAAGVWEVGDGNVCNGSATHCRDMAMRHLLAIGVAPTVTDNGSATSTIAGGDLGANITIGGGTVTSVTETFGTAYTNAPACVASGTTIGDALVATTTTTVVITRPAAAAITGVLHVVCLGF